MRDLLPVGSVVKLYDEYDLEYMITGYAPYDEQENASVYSAVLYPFGIEYEGNIFMINPEDIKQVVFLGYVEEGDDFLKLLNKTFVKNNSNDSPQDFK